MFRSWVITKFGTPKLELSQMIKPRKYPAFKRSPFGLSQGPSSHRIPKKNSRFGGLSQRNKQKQQPTKKSALAMPPMKRMFSQKR